MHGFGVRRRRRRSASFVFPTHGLTPLAVFYVRERKHGRFRRRRCVTVARSCGSRPNRRRRSGRRTGRRPLSSTAATHPFSGGQTGLPSLSMTRPCSSRWNSRKSPESSAPPPRAARRGPWPRVKVSAVRVVRARRPRMPPPPPSRRDDAAAVARARRLRPPRRGTSSEGTRQRSPRASVGGARARCVALGRSARSCCGRRPSPIVVPREKAKRRRRRTPPPSRSCRPRANSRRAVDCSRKRARGDLGL